MPNAYIANAITYVTPTKIEFRLSYIVSNLFKIGNMKREKYGYRPDLYSYQLSLLLSNC